MASAGLFWGQLIAAMPHIIGFLIFGCWCAKGTSKISRSCQIPGKENLQLDCTFCGTIELEKTFKEHSLLIII